MVSQVRFKGGSDGNSYSYPQSGVVDYPISKNMPLTGIWNHQPNSNGPVITAEQGMLDIFCRPQRNASNQWTKLRIQHYFEVLGGALLSFKVRYDMVQPATEVKLSLTCGVILRYDGKHLNYCCWDPNTEWFHILGRSSIQIGEYKSCRVALFICPDAIHIFENGNRIGVWRTRVSSLFQPVFDWQILNPNALLQATISEILVVTVSFSSGLDTPWDIPFGDPLRPLNDDVWQIRRQDHDPFRIQYPLDGYMRFSTARLSFRNSWAMTQATHPLLSDDGIVMYRFRINTARGSETKLTLFGGYTLHVGKNGQHATWCLHINERCVGSEGEGDSDSNIRVGSGVWTIVMVVYSPSSTTLFENGVAMFSSSRRFITSPRAPMFHVQHLDAGTAVEVDLSHVRSVPMLKTSEVLIRDLKPHVVTRYPLQNSSFEDHDGGAEGALIAMEALAGLSGFLEVHPTTSIAGGTLLVSRPSSPIMMNSNPSTPSALSTALSPPSIITTLLDSSPSAPPALSAALSPPSVFPASLATAHSYTFNLWLKVERFPSRQEYETRPVSILSLRTDGKLEFSLGDESLSYSSSRASQLNGVVQPPPLVSNTKIPLSQWVSVTAIYASEDLSFALFIDGEIDCVAYTTPTINGPNPYKIMLVAYSINAASSANEIGRLINFHGHVGHYMFFGQRLHATFVRALTNYLRPR